MLVYSTPLGHPRLVHSLEVSLDSTTGYYLSAQAISSNRFPTWILIVRHNPTVLCPLHRMWIHTTLLLALICLPSASLPTKFCASHSRLSPYIGASNSLSVPLHLRGLIATSSCTLECVWSTSNQGDWSVSNKRFQ
jgi:hypothetical protein